MILVPKGASFNDMMAIKRNKEISYVVNKIIARLAEVNDLKGKEMVDSPSRLVGIFEGVDLSANGAERDILLVKACEYLIRHFVTKSGKSK